MPFRTHMGDEMILVLVYAYTIICIPTKGLKPLVGIIEICLSGINNPTNQFNNYLKIPFCLSPKPFLLFLTKYLSFAIHLFR